MSACFPRIFRVAFFLLLPFGGSCTTDPNEQETEPVEEEPDLDTGTEPDSDTGTKPNGAFPWSVLDGEILYRSTIDGELHCDARIALTGTSYTGECEGCEWAFSIEAEVSEDNGSADCEMAPQLSYIANANYDSLSMAYVPVLETYSWWGDTYTYEVLMTGYDYFYYGTVYGPYWFPVSSSDESTGTFSRVGNEIEWTFDLEYLASAEAYSDLCDDFSESGSTQPYGGGFQGSSDLDCEGEIFDIWSFTTTDSGATLSVTVDTSSDDTAFDPMIWLRGPDDCSLIRADDNYECTYDPVAYRCPSLQVEESEAGNYQVVVASYGSCAGKTAAYALRVDGPLSGELLLELDDIQRYGETTHVLDIDGSATLIE